MFNIDLLKSSGLPIRTKPQGVAIFVATFAVPVLIAILLCGYYIRNKVVISVNKQNIISFDNQTKRLADALKTKDTFEKEKAGINNCMSDISKLIKNHFQWSPVLVALVENLPDSIVLTNLEIKQTTIKRKPAKGENDKDKKANLSIPVRTLKMRVSANPSYSSDLDIRTFKDKLRDSKFLGPRLEDIVIASQGHDTLDGRDVVCYDIDCIFKPGL
jgi:Tfp pilus assembly protein PilN